MKLFLSVSLLVCVVAMLFTVRPLALDSVIKSLRSRTPRLYQRFPNLSSYTMPRYFSNPSGSSSGPSCEKADREAYQQILINDDRHNLEDTFQLLMNIVKKPCLGHFVKRIEYVHRPGSGDDYPGLPYQRDLSADDMGLLRGAVKNAGFQGDKEERIINMLMQKELYQDLGYNTPEGCRVWKVDITPTFITQAIAAIIVSMSPNLETMAMTQPFYHYLDLEEGGEWAIEFPLVQVFRYANSRPDGGAHFLQKLRDVYLINKGGDYLSDGRFYQQTDLIACLELFNKLPSVESFGIDVLESDEDNGKQTWENANSNISKIKINHSALDSNYLLKVMASSKTLTEIQYTAGGRGSIDGGYPHFNPKAFIKALSVHKKTLKVLDIDVDEFVFTYPGEQDSSYSSDWDKYGAPDGFEFDAYEPDFLTEDDPDVQMHRYLISIWGHDASLKDFVALKELSVGIRFLIYFGQGVGIDDDAKRASVMLVDSLPDSLEYLTIRGYQKGANAAHDTEVAALMARFDSGSLRLKEIKGVDKIIPNGRDVENPDGNPHLLWSLEEVGYSDY